MLRTVTPDAPDRVELRIVPSIARPLVAARERGAPLAPVLQDIVRDLGFDDFMYGLTTSMRPRQESRSFVWTSLPAPWVRCYDERAYIEVDPRLRGAWQSALPFLWDAPTCAATPQERDFFDAAAGYGIRSGVSMALRNRFDAPGVFVLNSAAPMNDDARRSHIAGVLGNAMALGTFVHDLMLQAIAARCPPSTVERRALSARERDCLQLAAHGLTSREIGDALAIGERTVQTHFANLLAKLDAANRQEAIAMASASGIINA